jgi:hypothetical protein
MPSEFKKPKTVTSKRTCPDCGKVGAKGIKIIDVKKQEYYLICLRCGCQYLPPNK